MSTSRSINYFLILIAALLVVLHIANGIYIARGLPNCARGYDEAMNSEFSTFASLIKKASESAYAPLYDTQSFVISRVVGKRWTAIYLIHNSVFLIVLVVSLVLLGRKIADISTGLVAAIIVCLYPLLASAFNSYSMDFPLAGLMTLSVYLAIESRFFREPRFAFLCGLVMLYGVMIKEPFVAYMAVPLLVAAALGTRDAFAGGDFRRLRNVTLCVVSIAAVVYAYFGSGTVKALFWERLFMEPPESVGLPPKSLPYMLRSLWQSQVSLPLAVLLAVGAVRFQLKAPRIHRWTVWLWVLVPAAVIYAMPHHIRNRYFLLALPAYALMSAFALRPLLDRRAARWIAVPAVALLGSLQVFALEKSAWGITGWHLGDQPYWSQHDLPLALESRWYFCGSGEPIARALVRRSMTLGSKTGKHLFTVIPNDWGEESRFIHSYSIMNSPIRLDEYPKAFLAERLARTDRFSVPDDLKFLVFILPRGKPMDIHAPEYEAIFLDSYRSHCRYGYSVENPETVNRLPGMARGFLRGFELVEQVPIFDYSTGWIFQRKKQIPAEGV